MGLETYFYASDPGAEVLLGKGAVINIVRKLQRSPRYANGELTLGIVGQVTADGGAPGVPVQLENGSADLLGTYGPFLPHVGEGAAAGYEGNVCAQMDGVDAPRMVLVPVDMAVKTATIATGTDLLVHVARTKVLATTTGEADTEAFTSVAHGLAIGDSVTLSTLTGGTGATAGTYTVATVPSVDSFTLTGVAYSTDITAVTAVASYADVEAYTLPVGTRFKASGGYEVRTLAPVFWDDGDSAEKTVRVAQVSAGAGATSTTPVALNTVTTIVSTLADLAAAGASGLGRVRVTTTATDVPDEVDAAEIVLRYQAALDAINSTSIGAEIDAIFTDRNEAAINQALATHVTDSIAAGIFRIGVVAPPVGTSLATARSSSGDGIGLAALDRENIAYVHPGWRRAFNKDADHLTAPDYLATFTGQAIFAAILCTTRPEADPTAQPIAALRKYGASDIASPGYGGKLHWSAGIVSPQLLKLGGGVVPGYRDGILADGDSITTRRTEQWIAANAVERITPYHKGIASKSNRENAVDSVGHWLEEQKKAERIAAYAYAGVWDSAARHLVVQIAAEEIGTLNTITFQLAVSSAAIEFAAGSEAEAA